MSLPRGLRGAWTIKSEDVNVSTTFNIALTTVSASRIDALITIGGASRYLVDFWLVDAIATPNDRTLVPPTGDENVEFSKVTAADGTYTHSVNNTLAGKTWYLVAIWAGQYAISDAISF